MKVKFEFMFGARSIKDYRHYPLLYLATGGDGFCVCIIGLHITVKFKRKAMKRRSEWLKENGVV